MKCMCNKKEGLLPKFSRDFDLLGDTSCVLFTLLWLLLNFRVQFKILVTTFRAPHGQMPP